MTDGLSKSQKGKNYDSLVQELSREAAMLQTELCKLLKTLAHDVPAEKLKDFLPTSELRRAASECGLQLNNGWLPVPW